MKKTARIWQVIWASRMLSDFWTNLVKKSMSGRLRILANLMNLVRVSERRVSRLEGCLNPIHWRWVTTARKSGGRVITSTRVSRERTYWWSSAAARARTTLNTRKKRPRV